MPMSTRELYLVLRARDEASRTLRGVSRELLSTGAAAARASSNANAAIARETATRARRNAAAARELQYRARNNAAVLRERIAIGRLNGMTQAQIDHLQRQAIAQDQAARRAGNLARQHDNAARAANNAANAHLRNAQAAEDSARRQRHVISIMEQGGQALATAGVGIVAAGAVTAFALKNMVDVAIEYERQVKHTATQVDGFKGNLQELADMGRRIARDIALPFETIQPALFDIFSSTEANAKQAEMLLRAFAKAAVAGQVDVQEASRATIGVLNAFNRPLEDVNKVLDMQFQLIQEGVGNYDEWAQKIGLVSPSAARAGQSIEVMMAALATATRMGMSAARASTSVARAFDAMSNPKVVKNLKALGINALDASGHMRPFNDTLRELRAVILKMPEKDRVGAILDIFKSAGGTIEARRFLQTMLLVPGTLETFDSILGEMENSAGSLDNAYSLMADTAASKTVMLHNKWMLLKEGLGRALIPTFVTIMDWLMKLMNVFDRLSPSGQKSVAMFLVFASALSIVGGTILVVLGALAGIVAAFIAAGPVLLAVVGGVTAVIAVLALLGAGFALAWKKSEGFRMLILGMVDTIKTLWGMIVGFGQAFIAVVSEQLGPPLKQVAQYINEWVLPAFTSFRNAVAGEQLAAIKTWGSTLISFLGPVLKWCAGFITGTVLPAIKSLTQTWIENRERIMPIIDAMIFFGKVVGIIIGIVLILIGAGVFGALVGMFYLIAGVAKVVIGALAYVGDAFRVLMSIINSVIFWFRMLYQEVRDRIAGVLDIIRSLPMTIRNNLGNMDDLLLSAGRAVINGLINGIKQQIPSLGGVLSGIGGFIQDHKGPLDYDRRLLIPAGRAIMGGLMRGINDQMPALLDQINGINSTINLSTGQDSEGNSFRRPGLKPSGPPIVNKYYNIEQNITTQEISPRRTATQLGWEVTTVI